jgi:chromate transporter
MLAGTLGGLLTTWGHVHALLPMGVPRCAVHRAPARQKALSGALSAVTAAVVGVILNLAVWFALHTWCHETRPAQAVGLGFDAPVLSSLDPWAFALSIAAMVAIFRFKAGMISTLLACSAAGVALHLVGVV